MSDTRKVFLSYSHDSGAHVDWVVQLSAKLIENGIDVILDKWSLSGGDDIAHFMRSGLKDADRVITICTDNYVNKSANGQGGVGFESAIVTAEYMKDINSNKVIPIVRQTSGGDSVPDFLGTKMYIDMRTEKLELENFDFLCRTILEAPLLVKPELGTNPYIGVTTTEPVKPVNLSDPKMDIFKTIVALYEMGNMTITLDILKAKHRGLSRIAFDVYINELTNQKLISKFSTYSGTGGVSITDKGRVYAFESNFVSQV